MRSDESQVALSDPVLQMLHRTPPTTRKNFRGREPEKLSSTEFQLKPFLHPESKGHQPFYQQVQSMAFSFHYCRVRAIRATIFRSRLPHRHAYSNRSRDLKRSPRVQYPQQFSPTPTRIRPEHPSGFHNSEQPKHWNERFGRWSAYTGIGMVGLIGGFWFWNQETVPITGRRRFNFISHEYLEENEHKFSPYVFLFHLTMAIIQDKPTLLLPADHPMNVVVQKVFYRLLEAQGQDPSDWKISVVRAPGRTCPINPVKTQESQMLIFSEINTAVATANKQVLVYSGAFSFCQDEAGLACLIASQIAACIVERRGEVISHYYFVRFSAVPAIPLIISAFLLPPTAAIAVPYIAIWAAYAWGRDAAGKIFVNRQDRYAGFILMARAGYDLQAGIGYWIRNLEGAEQIMAGNAHLNSPFHKEVCNKSSTLDP
jgi:hypothetical protein